MSWIFAVVELTPLIFRGCEEVLVVARVPFVCKCLCGSECFDAQIVGCLIESRRQYVIVPLNR